MDKGYSCFFSPYVEIEVQWSQWIMSRHKISIMSWGKYLDVNILDRAIFSRHWYMFWLLQMLHWKPLLKRAKAFYRSSWLILSYLNMKIFFALYNTCLRKNKALGSLVLIDFLFMFWCFVFWAIYVCMHYPLWLWSKILI